jgi:hypothetical protein
VKRELELLVPGSAPDEESEKLPQITRMFSRTREADSGKKNQFRMRNLPNYRHQQRPNPALKLRRRGNGLLCAK